MIESIYLVFGKFIRPENKSHSHLCLRKEVGVGLNARISLDCYVGFNLAFPSKNQPDRFATLVNSFL
jgi:hypothetical protein